MDRVILHCDLNSFYASVELLDHPELRDRPVAVCGDPNSRHGIILAKNEPAKRYKVQTAETIWQARRKCPELVLLPAHHWEYRDYSRRVNAVYERYTDLVEPFSIDESWLDITGSLHLFGGDAKALADEIRRVLREELGLTVSVGASFNKIFAKMGSDYKKPDATTVISRENYQELLWPLPITSLLFVGRSAAAALEHYGVHTIGDLARLDREAAASILGRQGCTLHDYASGAEHSPVVPAREQPGPKSVGNGLTFPRNLVGWAELHAGVTELADEVAVRLRGHGLKCTTLQVTIRDPNFKDICRQKRLSAPTYVARELSDRDGYGTHPRRLEGERPRARPHPHRPGPGGGGRGRRAARSVRRRRRPPAGTSWRSWKRPWTAYGTNSAGMPSLRPLPSTGTGPKSKRSSACPRWTEYLDAARQRRIHHDQAIFFDVDGTLLSHRTGRISPHTRACIRALRAGGTLVFLSTGRHILELRSLPVGEMAFDGYITLNGQLCLDSSQQQLSSTPLPPQAVQALADLFCADGPPLALVEEERIYINRVTDAVRQAQAEISTPIPEVAPYTGRPVYQATAFCSRKEDPLLRALLPTGCKLARWSEGGVDIIPEAGGKAAGMRRFLTRFGLSRLECMAFGDAENDLDMLAYAGIELPWATPRKR